MNAKQFIEAHCLNALPKSARQYRYMVYDKPGFGEGAFGRLSGLREREGKVVAIDPEWVGVKERTNTFVVLSIAMISPLDMGHLKLGDRVTIHFPQVRRFDGKRANGEDDPAIGNSRIITLTGATTRLPVHWPAEPETGRCAREASRHEVSHEARTIQLIQAVEQLEAICFGARTAAGVMADAIVPGSRLEIFEDVDGQTFTISMQARFADGHVGRFEIRYDRGSDYYVVVGTDTHLDVCFDVLADVIGRELGAANWGQVRIDFEKYQRRVA